MEGLFDLNIEQVLENWSIADALREIIANALDEQVLSKTQDIEIVKQNDVWHIRDYGRGIQYIHFTQNENDEKNRSNKLIGKFGVGLKDALAVLYRHGCGVRIESKYNSVTTKMAMKSGFDIQTLHAEFCPSSDNKMKGTDFAITGISDKDMEDAKHRFLIFNNLSKLESTKYGEVYSCENTTIPSIYINGVKVAEEPNFMFNYNITSMNTQIRKALNRERSNVGRVAYADTIKKILKSCKSDDVLLSFVKDLQNRMYGTNKDETTWVDVASHAAKTLNKNGNVVFMTPMERASLTNQQLEILEESGKQLIMVTEDVFGKIRSTVETFDNIYNNYNDSFQYEYIKYNDLSDTEKHVFDLKNKIMDFLSPRFRKCKNVKVSETIRVSEFGGLTLAVCEEDSIIIKRSVLSNAELFCGVFTHELCHYQYGSDDNTRDFESDLTEMLGYSIYRFILECEES